MPMLQDQVRAECKLIPNGDLDQGLFKMGYEIRREVELSKPEAERQTKQETLDAAIADVRKANPTFQARYDRSLTQQS